MWRHRLLYALSNVVHVLCQAVTFTVAMLPAEQSALKTHGGVTNGLVLDHANGAGTPLVTDITPGAALTNVALFIDTSKAALTPLAQEKYWWCASPQRLRHVLCSHMHCYV